MRYLWLAASCAAGFHSTPGFAADIFPEQTSGFLGESQWSNEALQQALSEWKITWIEATRHRQETGQNPRPSKDHATALLDCEFKDGSGSFWSDFRKLYQERGPLDPEVLVRAVKVWRDWEGFVDALAAADGFDGRLSVPVSDQVYSNGSFAELQIFDRQDLLRVLQQARHHSLFGTPRSCDSSFAGALCCPTGFLLAQFALFVVQKLRVPMSEEDMALNWKSVSTTAALLLGTPIFSFDHLESANWGIDTWDILVNLEHVESRTYFRSYQEYCEVNPVPAAEYLRWQHLSAQSMQRRQAVPRTFFSSSGSSTTIFVAVMGEHAPSNIEHLSVATRALEREGLTTDFAHYFTYLWNLQGTEEGRKLQEACRVTWYDFWGSHLTASQGRIVDEAPNWTVRVAVEALSRLANQDEFLRRATLTICSEPLWLCVLLHQTNLFPRLITRASAAGRVACFLVDFYQVFGAFQVQEYWSVVRNMRERTEQQLSVSATSPMTAAMMKFQAGFQVAYVPCLSLHLVRPSDGKPSKGILLFRSSLPGSSAFFRLLEILTAELDAPPIFEQMLDQSMSFDDIRSFRSAVMLPHIPNALRLSDVYALNVPILVPGAPMVNKFVWPYDPLPSKEDLVDHLAQGRSQPPFSPLDFQYEPQEIGVFLHHTARRYWLQFTEWQVRPHLLRFTSARRLLELALLPDHELEAVRAAMRKEHSRITEEALSYWKASIFESLARSTWAPETNTLAETSVLRRSRHLLPKRGKEWS